MPRIVYSRHYNIGFLGIERLHPFDSCKYGRAWRCLRHRFGRALHRHSVRPSRPVSERELLALHTPEYLARLRNAQYVARALELPPLARLPAWLIDWRVLLPMRWAAMGSIMATEEALRHGLAFNLGGGFHHAKPTGGEGFCIYSDISLAICNSRRQGQVTQDQAVAYIDLDAHQGNGVCHAFMHDDRVFIFDIYNSMIYPSYDTAARERIDCNLPVSSGCGDVEYLSLLHDRLPGFLDSIGRTHGVGLAVYVAGTDVYRGDPLGGMLLSAEAVLERDMLVVETLQERGIPTVMLLGGGYTSQSYRLVTETVGHLLQT